MRAVRILAILGMEGVLICGVAAAQPPSGQAAAEQPLKSRIILREMTEVPLTFAENVSSKTAKPGQTVEFVLAEDLKVGEALIAKRGTRALGTVVHSKTPDFWGEPGELNIRITFLKVGITKVPLRGASGDVGKRYVVTRGSQAVFKIGTPVKAFVDADTEVVPLAAPPMVQNDPSSPLRSR